jgi:hypothetical protein
MSGRPGGQTRRKRGESEGLFELRCDQGQGAVGLSVIQAAKLNGRSNRLMTFTKEKNL